MLRCPFLAARIASAVPWTNESEIQRVVLPELATTGNEMGRGVPRRYTLDAARSAVYWFESVLRRLLPLLLAALTLLGRPGVSEAFENAGHVVLEGHGVHAQELADHEAHDPMHLEHGCGGGVHVCPCHAPSIALWSQPLGEVVTAPVLTTLALDSPRQSSPLGFRSALFRPPTC